MDTVFNLISPEFWVLAIIVTLIAGFVKGAVGFAMPMIMISGLGSFLTPELALAALILPTVLSNLLQTMRGGFGAAWASARKYWRYIAILLLFIALSAQLVAILPPRAMYLIVGLPITMISLSQLLGWRPHIRQEIRARTEALVAVFAGIIGGIAGVWGPPTTAYLTAIDTPKAEQIRVQGVIFGVGSVVLFFAHIRSGVLNSETMPFSALMIIPAIAGMMIGFRFHDRLDQEKFRRVTLIVLVIAGLNLIRRGLFS